MKINSLILYTNKITELAAFYEKVLHLSVTRSNDDFTIHLKKSSIRFKQCNDSEGAFYHFAITIPCNKIEEAKEWLQHKVELLWIEDYKSVIADFVNWNAKSIYFIDAAGNIVELIARLDLSNPVDEIFSSKHLLSVSEIGLVLPENRIEKDTLILMKQYSLSYFSKQRPFSNFKAVGDDEGLFIIVTAQRNWYPTNKASRIFPMQVEFEVFGKNFVKSF